MVELEIRTHGPMSYFPLRRMIEERLAETGIARGLVTIHAGGATPAIIVIGKDELRFIDEALKNMIPVVGWVHGNAYAHLRSTIASTVKTLVFGDGRLILPDDYEVYFLETRPVYNHRRKIHLYIRGVTRKEE